MSPKPSPFELHFEIIFLENYSRLKPNERKTVDKAVRFLSANPRHPSLNVHKAKNVRGKYAEGGNDIFIAYASKDLRLTFEYGPRPGMIALRNCGHHEPSEREI
jgi:hypothetical protein